MNTMYRSITLANMPERDAFTTAWNDVHRRCGLVPNVRDEFRSPVPFVHQTNEPCTFAVAEAMVLPLSAVLRCTIADLDNRARCYAIIDERQCVHGKGAHVLARASATEADVTRAVLRSLGTIPFVTVARKFVTPSPLCGCRWCDANEARLRDAFDTLTRAVRP